jgi:serine/threonine-protein kinase
MAIAPRLEAAPTDPAAAEMLFGDAKRLMAETKYEEACPKLAESQRLDPAVGTLLYLADCYEQLGKTATAWATFKEALGVASRMGDGEREKAARDRAAALEAKLSRLKITVSDGAPADLTIRRDGISVGRALWSTPFPVDPGKHVIEVAASGKKAWTRTVDVPSGGTTTQVDVPTLEGDGSPELAATVAGGSPAPVDKGGAPSSTSSSSLPTIGWIVVGVGAVGVGVGTYFVVQSHSKRTEAEGLCPQGQCPESRRNDILELQSDSNDLGRIGVIGLAAGGAALVTGLTLVLSSLPKADETHASVAPYIAAGRAGVRGTF